MARQIVRQESLMEPCNRSRLGEHEVEEDLIVLRDCTGTKTIEGLCLELPELNDEHINAAAFANMSNLRLLHLNNLFHLSGTYRTTFRKLKWLCWHGFPLANIPADLYMENLVAIDLQYSKLKQIWKGTKRLEHLRFLNLSHSCRLTKTLDFSGLKSLEELLLHDCTNLVEVHNSIGCLDKLLVLNMANCKNLTKLPTSILMLKSLQHLDLSGYSKLNDQVRTKGPPSIFQQVLIRKPQECLSVSATSILGLSSLRSLALVNCNMSYMPSEIDSLQSLAELNLEGNKFSSLPSSISNLSRLQKLLLYRCDKLKSLPDLPDSLLLLNAADFKSFEPESVRSQLGKVRWMKFRNCTKLDDSNFRRNILQLYQGHSILSLSLPGSDVPSDQFQFQGFEPGLSFIVPARVGMNIQGLIVCAVALIPDIVVNVCHEVINKTKGTILLSQSYGVSGDPMWFHYVILPNDDGFNLEGGDEVDLVYIREDSDIIEVESGMLRCGIVLIYGD